MKNESRNWQQKGNKPNVYFTTLKKKNDDFKWVSYVWILHLWHWSLFQRLCSCICKIPIRSFRKDELWCHSQLHWGSVWLFLQHADRLLILPSHISPFWNHSLVFIRPGRLMLMSLAFSEPYRVGLQSIKLRKWFSKHTSDTAYLLLNVFYWTLIASLTNNPGNCLIDASSRVF